MNDAPRYTNLRDYLRVLREQRIIIVLVTIVFAGAAFGLSAREKAVYQAAAALSFQDESRAAAVIGADVGFPQAPDALAATESQTILRPEILTVARRLLKLKPGESLPGTLSAFAEARTNFVVIQTNSGKAKSAAALANAAAAAAQKVEATALRARYSRAAADLRRRLKKLGHSQQDIVTRSSLVTRISQLETLRDLSQPVKIVRSAGVPARPVSPRPVRNTILGLLLGLTIGILAAFVRDSLDRRLRGAREISDELKLPLLGHVREEALGRTTVTQNGRKALHDVDIEGFRILRTNLEFLSVDSPVKTIVVTSGLPEEGKSTVASSLAAAYATGGRRTLLVECDLRRPTFAARLGLNQTPGLTDFLSGQADPQAILQTVRLQEEGGDEAAGANLVCITAGARTPHPAEILGSERFKAFLAQVAEVYDVVVLDTSPLLSVVDTLELLPLVDGILVCVRASQTTRDQAKAAKAALARLPDRPTGLVVTGVRKSDELDYGYYSYAYAYGAKD